MLSVLSLLLLCGLVGDYYASRLSQSCGLVVTLRHSVRRVRPLFFLNLLQVNFIRLHNVGWLFKLLQIYYNIRILTLMYIAMCLRLGLRWTELRLHALTRRHCLILLSDNRRSLLDLMLLVNILLLLGSSYCC